MRSKGVVQIETATPPAIAAQKEFNMGRCCSTVKFFELSHCLLIVKAVSCADELNAPRGIFVPTPRNSPLI